MGVVRVKSGSGGSITEPSPTDLFRVFAFSVEPEAIPEIAEHLRERGLLARGPVDFGEGGTAVFCFDPDGNEVEFQDYFCRLSRQGG